MSLTYQDIEAAEKRIRSYVIKTPLFESEPLRDLLRWKGKIFLKLDNQQPTGSFKVRGAFNKILTLPETTTRIVAFSSGNFAQAVAYACKKLGKDAVIVMPKNSPRIKIEGTLSHGAKIVYSEATLGAAAELEQEIIKREGRTEVHPYNDYATMAGQGTLALEVLEVLPSFDHFFCPVGGGGLMSGNATALKARNPNIKTYAVEPWGARDFYESIQTGKKVTLDKVDTIADGLRSPTVGSLNYPILLETVDEALTVTEEEIIQAMKILWQHHQFKIEPSGAVSLAGLIKYKDSLSGNVVVVISGQNVDPDKFEAWMSNA